MENKEAWMTAKKAEETIVDLKRMLEQVYELRRQYALMTLKIRTSYQSVSLVVLDELRRQLKETEGGTQEAKKQKEINANEQ